ncbi:hypothetical protein Tco_0782941 [Tanacetum coccineum]
MSVRNAVLNEWVLDSFDIETDYGKTRDDPYSRRFDEYKKLDDALPLGRANGSIFMEMIRKEMNEEGGRTRALEQETQDLDMEIKQMKSIFSLCYLFRNPFSSTTMGDENPICTLGDYSKPSHEGYRNTIELPVGNNVVPL